MGDYLRNLVRRATAPVGVRPRARSLFEPVKGAPGMEFSALEKVESPEKPPTVESPRVSVERPRAVERPPVVKKVAVAERGEVSAPPFSVPAPVPVHKTAEPEVRTAMPSPVHVAERIEKTVVRRDEPSAPIPVIETLVAEPVRPPAQPADVAEPIPVAPAPLKVRSTEQVRARHSERPAPLEKQAAPKPVRPIIEARIPDTRQPAVVPQAPAPAPDPEIHISIGRVVVHAAPASPSRPASEARSHAPRVSLEQYLHGRDVHRGGGAA
jgi:hypothetical protein